MNQLRSLMRLPWVGPLLALATVYSLFAILVPDTFLGTTTLELMARQTVIVALCAVGMTLVIIGGGIDLSVGSTVALVTVVTALVLRAGHGAVLAAAAGVLAGLAAGALNGTLIASLKIPPFIVTLGTMSIFRGLAKGLASEQKIEAPARGLESLMAATDLEHGKVVPLGIVIAAVLTLIGAVILSRGRFGRHLVATGSSPRTARLVGISIPTVTVVTYASLGLLTGVAGLMEFSSLTVGDPTDSIGRELQVIAAVVIGGASLNGGRGSIAGSLFGALLMAVIATGSRHLGLANWIQEILTGVIIVVAVSLDRFRGAHRQS